MLWQHTISIKRHAKAKTTRRKKDEICSQTKPGFTFNLSLFARVPDILSIYVPFSISLVTSVVSIFFAIFFLASQAINNFSLDLLFFFGNYVGWVVCLSFRLEWKCERESNAAGWENELDDPTRQVGDKAFSTGTVPPPPLPSQPIFWYFCYVQVHQHPEIIYPNTCALLLRARFSQRPHPTTTK